MLGCSVGNNSYRVMSGDDGSATSGKFTGNGETNTFLPILSGQALVLLSSLAGLVLVSLVFLWLSI